MAPPPPPGSRPPSSGARPPQQSPTDAADTEQERPYAETERRTDVPGLAALVGRIGSDELDVRQRASLLGSLTAALGRGARAAGGRATVSGRWLADLVAELAQHIPVRDVETLSQHHGGLRGAELAEALTRSAARATAGVGAAGGGLTAVQVAAPPTLLAAPLQLTAETLAVVAVELKLVAELHVVAGRAPLAPAPEVAAAYLSSWVTRTALRPGGRTPAGRPGFGAVLGSAARQQLRRRVARRLGRNLSTMAPFLAGAVAGAELNRRETQNLAKALRTDLDLLAG